jgi:hypothetical protein
MISSIAIKSLQLCMTQQCGVGGGAFRNSSDIQKGETVVHDFVKTCQICIQAKPDRVSYPGKPQSLSVPKEAWETISMDFMEGLPKSSSASCILVIVDTFTKFSHFLLLAHPYTASSVAMAFFNMIYRLHGLPTSIVSDQDPVFISKFWQIYLSCQELP